MDPVAPPFLLPAAFPADAARPPSPSWYKRPLPETCIPFASSRGKELFATALGEGGMDSYFPLASQFLTQNEPAFCGLGTLCMILNALEIDPQRKWKGPWRWYEQEMLDCCRPLDTVASVGITISELACLARCNGLTASVVSPNPSATQEERAIHLAKFRNDLKAASRGDHMMALGYSRKALGQTGDGHFSPIGGYSQKDDMLLVLDVARFKYPSYWISVEQAWDAMLPLDKATGQPRGYIQLSVLPASNPLSLAGPPSLTTLSLNKSSWAALSSSLNRILLSTKSSASASDLVRTVGRHISTLPTPILIARATAADKIAPLVASLQCTALHSLTTPSDPLSILALGALFQPRSALSRLVPPDLRPGVHELVEEALVAGGPALKAEIGVLSTQIDALGECCKAEQGEGAACGCATVKATQL